MPQLIKEGHLFIAQPPLYRIDWGQETHWALTDEERDDIVARMRDKGGKKISIQRFKGLGEMMADTLNETTLDPENRHLLQVSLAETNGAAPDEEQNVTDQTIQKLMGRDASKRFDFIMNRAQLLDEEELDI
jgi:DNA gyrase subunit B/topoisomerase-4 subunit B